ncbi:lysozyme inhibitor LprI family protein [Undibacterium sp. Ji49W]|uniref:lysozyme inhibitor LprI family protein n=1 Tax=Undibacterium sp. Ji49W TaxID=3413040 RepID=UPI003BF30025
MKPLFLFFILLCAGASSYALDCKKAVSTMDLNECATIEAKKVEAKLNRVYQQALKSLDQPDTETELYSEMKKKLINAQRAWVKFREADCDAVFQRHASGSIRTIMQIGCMQTHAERRIQDLEDYEKN